MLVLSCCGAQTLYGKSSSTEALYICPVGWFSTEDQVRPPFSVTVAPPSPPPSMRRASVGSIHSAWWSPCGSVVRAVKLSPPSVDFQIEVLRTYTTSGPVGSAATCV